MSWQTKAPRARAAAMSFLLLIAPAVVVAQEPTPQRRPTAPAPQQAAPAQQPLVVTAPAVQQPGERQVTLEEAVDLALKQSPAIVQSEGSIRTARSSERSAYGAFLPSLSLSTGAGLSSTERINAATNTTVTGSADSYTAGLSSNFDIFTGGRRGAELKRTRAVESAAQATLVEQQFSVTLNAKTAFFNVLRADELTLVANTRIAQAQKTLDMSQQRFRVGSATRSDVLRSTLELNQAKQALLQAQTQRRTATFALGRLVGVPGPVGAKAPADTVPRPLLLSDEQLIALVIAQAPTVRSAEATVASGEASLKSAKTQYLPTLRLQTGTNWFNTNPQFNGGRGSWSLNLGLSYPLFNNFQREDAIARADVQADIARANLQDARLFARSELERILANLRLAEQQLPLAQEAVTVAEEDLRVQQQRYSVGASTIIDELTSQLNLITAQQNLVTARFDYQLARAALEALVGRTL
jgi:outer membrane protein